MRLADLNTGHNIIATVFRGVPLDLSGHRAGRDASGWRGLFVAGIAAMSASGGYDPIKVAQGIVGYADLTG